jgi:hypothetical protein
MDCDRPGSLSMKRTVRSRLKASVAVVAICAQLVVSAEPVSAFCGFYVAQADAKLFNKSSKVVIARNGQRTAITMASDYEGEPNEFALVVPVPTFIEKSQISVVETTTVDHLDAYTAPRLVEYYDPDPCPPRYVTGSESLVSLRSGLNAVAPAPPEAAYRYRGLKVEARYDVAEYDISILSAEESDGLINWLTDNGYGIPPGAEPVIGSYVKQQMRFFVAKVNLKRMQQLGRAYLRPLQVRYETAKFMLPLRLGTVNANGPQDLIVYALTTRGRVEATNYRTVKVPSNIDVPLFIKDDFANFYQATFDTAVKRENMHAVFVEYAWNMGSCDPCAAPAMSNRELVELGTQWTDSGDAVGNRPPPRPTGNAFVTRLHLRYDAKSFPEDLNFIETSDRENFQGRYVMHHPFVATRSCPADNTYRASLPARFKQEAKNLADVTGWSQQNIEALMETTGQSVRQ